MSHLLSNFIIILNIYFRVFLLFLSFFLELYLSVGLLEDHICKFSCFIIQLSAYINYTKINSLKKKKPTPRYTFEYKIFKLKAMLKGLILKKKSKFYSKGYILKKVNKN